MKEIKRKIEGYLLIKPELERAAASIAYPGNSSSNPDKLIYIFKDESANFTPGSEVCQRFEKAGVLDIWFKPVYREEFTTFIIGNPETTITITKEGILANSNLIPASEVETIITLIKRIPAKSPVRLIGKKEAYDMIITSATIQIGCTEFTLDELYKIIDSYISVNKK
jgi:hypothetical protein